MDNSRLKMYYEMFTDVWKLFRHHSNPDGSIKFWQDYTKAADDLDKKYSENNFLRKLITEVTKELEKIEKEGEKT